MRQGYLSRFVRLLVGLCFYGIGVAFNVSSGLGLAPWTVLNHGLSIQVGIKIGQAGQLMGLAILLIDLILREPIGFGTIGNMYFIGSVTDLVLDAGIIPTQVGLPLRALYLLLGMVITVFATFFYMSAGLGAGPRDSLMVGCTKRTQKLQVGTVRMLLEGSAVLIGWLMGGSVGLGTLACAFGMGPLTQIIFKRFSYNVRSVHQESIFETSRKLFGKSAPTEEPPEEAPALEEQPEQAAAP